jgi:hypothetical protein
MSRHFLQLFGVIITIPEFAISSLQRPLDLLWPLHMNRLHPLRKSGRLNRNLSPPLSLKVAATIHKSQSKPRAKNIKEIFKVRARIEEIQYRIVGNVHH